MNCDLLMKIEFPILLGSQGRVYIPKAIVERFELWEDTPIDVTVLIHNYKRVRFPTRVRRGWMFTIPKRVRYYHDLHYKDPLHITLTKGE